MFFTMIKLIVVFLLFVTPICLTNVYINFTNETPNYMVIPSELGTDLILTQMILHLFAIILLIAVFPKVFQKGRDRVMTTLKNHPSATDFTIMITGLPTYYSIDDLRTHMEKILDDFPTPVETIVPTYDIKMLSDINRRIHEWKERLALILEGYEIKIKTCRRTENIDTRMCLEFIKQDQTLLKEVVDAFDNTNRGQVAFVSYKSFVHAKLILEDLELPFFKLLWNWVSCKIRNNQQSKLFFNGSWLRFNRPPHATDILWENLNIPFTKALKSRVLTYTVSIIILGFAIFVLYALREYQHTEESSTLTLLPSVLILFINLVLEFFMAIITRYELHTSYTNYKVSVARKLIVLMFLNTAVIPTVVNSYIVNEKDEWFESGGLCSDVYTIIMINAIFPPLFYLYLFNPLYLLFLAQLRAFTNKLENGARVSQNQANEYFTPIEIDLAERYAQVIKTVYVGLFFCPLVPLSVVFSIVGVLLEFFVTKYMLNKHPLPRVHNESLILEMFEWLRYSICVYAVGVAFFYFEIDGNTSDNYTWDSVVYTALAITILGLAYFFVPVNHLLMKKLYKKLKDEMNHDMESEHKMNNYRHFRMKLDIDYERANPSTRNQANANLEEDKKNIENNGILDEYVGNWNIGRENLVFNIEESYMP